MSHFLDRLTFFRRPSEPFAEGDTKQIAVKVIDDPGNELLVVKDLREAR